MKPFAQFNYDDAAQLLGPRLPVTDTQLFPANNPRRPPTAQSATQFHSGDHWQSARGFIGQLPPLTLPGASQILADIKAAFVSENVTKEVVDTHKGAILGREPAWSFLKSDVKLGAKITDTDRDLETGETLTAWWNSRQALRDLQKAVTILLCEGRVVRRVFFPRGRLNGTGKISAPDITRALDFIYFETVTADIAGVFKDPDTQQEIGIFLFNETRPDGEVIANCAELSFLDANGNTVCKVVKDKGAPEQFDPYQLGGRLLIYELERDALITEQVQSSQRSLNLAHTMMMRNVNMAGARERMIFNAKPPVEVPGVDIHTGAKSKKAGTHKVGPGAVNYIQGWPIYGEDGKTIIGYTNPNASVTDPVAVTTFKDTINTEKEAIYSQCHQRHVLIVDKADTSGRAREVARREFERSLKETKTVVDACGRWQLETVLRLAAQVSGQVSKYAKLRADFNCVVDAGEVDTEKQKTVIELRKPGGPRAKPLISDETARGMIGLEDPAAELVKIDQEATQPPGEPAPLQPIDPNQPVVNGGVDNSVN
jgi:hypothetical protein